MGTIDTLFRLDGLVAFVTGAASGLGQVIAEGFADSGAETICADIAHDRLDGIVKGIRERGGKAMPVALDVADATSVETAFAALRDAGKTRLDILVNCAGVAAMPARTHELSIADWHRVVAINLTGTFLVTRAALPSMLGHEGSIINFASVLGITGYYPGFASTGLHYAATKAAIGGLTRQLAAEYAADNIRANVIAPGWMVGTRLGDFRRSKMDAAEQARFLAEIKARIPMGRTGDPQEILGLALYLAAPASRYVTGQLIAQDGGWTAC